MARTPENPQFGTNGRRTESVYADRRARRLWKPVPVVGQPHPGPGNPQPGVDAPDMPAMDPHRTVEKFIALLPQLQRQPGLFNVLIEGMTDEELVLLVDTLPDPDRSS